MSGDKVFDSEQLKKDLPEAGEAETMKDNAEDIGGIKIRPWGFDEIEGMTPVFERILLDLKTRKLSMRDFFAKTEVDDGKGGKTTKIEVLNFDQLYFCIMPRLREIFKVTLHLTDEEISKISPDLSAAILAKIVMQNLGYLKNSFALIMTLTARIGA